MMFNTVPLLLFLASFSTDATTGLENTMAATSGKGRRTSKAAKASKSKGDSRCGEDSLSVSCGDTLSDPDKYYTLDDDLHCSSGIEINATGIVLDCGNNKIVGGTGVGILVNADDVTLKDCVISWWSSFGMLLKGERAKLIRVSSTNNDFGLFLSGFGTSSGRASAEVFDSVFSNNGLDGFTVDSADLFMADSEVSSNRRNGVYAARGSNVTLVDVNVDKNGEDGILEEGAAVKLHETRACENNQLDDDYRDVFAPANDANVFNSVTCDTSNPRDVVCNCSCPLDN